MKLLKTPTTTVALPTTKILFISLRCACLPGRFDTLTKQHLIRDFTKITMLAEGKSHFSEDANRVWVHIVELQIEDWGIGGHTDWLRNYESALNVLGTEP